ncbi:hypothetical protein KR51_00011880 [Rubidibacter lacunae KORDI 51-2]|uniref:Tetratricopeptide repeat protein n=1 Tax=Rubidibacter lacunae KORDI 51-2 TaxID=582515 RepID=U5DR05_9CHRO|nr:hypothetical protein [Rubidibacter lacunae]ERN42100.1 hypothetical protein KR51_00011880 [Rubidibacter lacunae KORDI 51-2]
MLMRPLSHFALSCLTVGVLCCATSTVRAQTPAVEVNDAAAETEGDGTDVSEEVARPLAQPDSLLSLQGGERLLAEAGEAIDAENYDLAEERLLDARRVFNQLSNFYQQLASSFQGIDFRVAESQRQQAVQTAQLRDEATYRLALVHRAKGEPELAVPLLVQVVRSQNPTSELGQKAYRQLFELGFVDTQFPPGSSRPQSAPTTTTGER